MSYASQADLETRFGAAELVALTDRTGAGAIDGSVVERALADAVAMADSYLQRRHTLPLSSTPPALKPVVCDIARYKLHEDAPTEVVRRRYEDARDWLRDVAHGRVVLEAASPGSSATPGLTPAPAAASHRAAYTAEQTRGF